MKDTLCIPRRVADRITRLGSSKYVRDPTSHLTAVSGCRISPGVRAQGLYKVAYLQMYMTDKAVTYRPEGFHWGKHLTGKEILKNKAEDYCRGLYNLYCDASQKNYGHARIEVRVPIQHADKVMVDVDIDLYRRSLVSFDPVIWW